MKKLAAFFLAAFFLTLAGAAPVVTPERIWAELKQPGQVVHVNASSPTPFMVGFRGDECQLLVNDRMERSVGIALVLAVAHEAGHCEAVKAKVHLRDEVSRRGEGFADVYALAWVSVNRPEQLDEAFQLLMSWRKQSRRENGAYDTLFILNFARVSLPVKTTPLAFALDITK